MTYRGLLIKILVGRDNLYFYRISGKGLRFLVDDGQGEETEERAIDAAKEFVEDYLIDARVTI